MSSCYHQAADTGQAYQEGQPVENDKPPGWVCNRAMMELISNSTSSDWGTYIVWWRDRPWWGSWCAHWRCSRHSRCASRWCWVPPRTGELWPASLHLQLSRHFYIKKPSVLDLHSTVIMAIVVMRTVKWKVQILRPQLEIQYFAVPCLCFQFTYRTGSCPPF